MIEFGQRSVKKPDFFGRNDIRGYLEKAFSCFILRNRLSKNRILGGWWKMSSCKASEIPRNEAYIEVRRSDEGNAANGRFPTVSKIDLNPEMFSRFFSFPADPIDQWMVEPDRPLFRAILHTSPTIPAFIRK
jgi:hypothetical protein